MGCERRGTCSDIFSTDRSKAENPQFEVPVYNPGGFALGIGLLPAEAMTIAVFARKSMTDAQVKTILFSHEFIR
ncbi:MAG: hypothetical protein A2603_11515 [Bdellovibrionales bacterium RIFOXYD1_FULL_55_31]|nr:MAG: hypothetical protein A2603_11515 [Bdellovibrionales bacterium RIFOXYD1_FULL_55_31]